MTNDFITNRQNDLRLTLNRIRREMMDPRVSEVVAGEAQEILSIVRANVKNAVELLERVKAVKNR